MAYDLFFRKQTASNWSRRSYASPATGSPFLLASYTFSPDSTPTTDAEKQFLAKLAVIKMLTNNGDKKALKRWRRAVANIMVAKRRADQGDVRAQRLVKILNESGIFAGVQSMSVTGGSA